jgi:hypothetical protein
LELRRELGARLFVAECLEGLGAVATAARPSERAARLFGAAEALRKSIHSPLPPYMQAEQERVVSAARGILPSAVFAAAWAKGQAFAMDQAIAYACNDA